MRARLSLTVVLAVMLRRDRHASREAGEIEPGEVPLPPPPMPGGVVGEVPMGGALPPPPGATGYPPPYDGAGSGGGYEQA